MRRRLGIVIWLALAATLFAPVVTRAEAATLLSAYRSHTEEITAGVERRVFRRVDVPQAINVLRIEPSAAVEYRAVPADRSSGRLRARTSTLCARVGCLAAVNGDFFATWSGLPSGGVVSNGQAVRSPNSQRPQLLINGRQLSAGNLWWRTSVLGEGLSPFTLSGVNVARATDATVLFTRANGLTTGTNVYGNELVVRSVEPSLGFPVSSDTRVQLVQLRTAVGNAAIPPDGAVLSGHGAGARALADLWNKAQSGLAPSEIIIRTEINPSVTQSIGGFPVLVRDGRRAFTDAATSFVRGRHPRTVVGWNSAGETYLVTIDGRQAGWALGMSLAEAADFMIALGAVEALNLDGGGSTTFVRNSAVANRPSDRLVRRDGRTIVVPYVQPGDVVLNNVERSVANALAVVPAA
jgi:hypothetical protein